MIKVNIGEIKKEPGRIKIFEYDIVPHIAEFDLVSPFFTRLKFNNAASRIIVNGYLQAGVRLECVRCLEEFTYIVETNFYEELLPLNSPELEDSAKLQWEDLSIFTYEGDQIDVYEMIRQNIIASIPIKPLCSIKCKGICPQCGEVLNEVQCKC